MLQRGRAYGAGKKSDAALRLATPAPPRLLRAGKKPRFFTVRPKACIILDSVLAAFGRRAFCADPVDLQSFAMGMAAGGGGRKSDSVI